MSEPHFKHYWLLVICYASPITRQSSLIMDLTLTKTRTSAISRGYLIGLTGIFFWSWTGIFISYLLKNYPLAPMTLAFWRDVVVTTTLIGGR